MYKRHITGILGEKLASKYLKENNYKIIKKNFRCGFGEIDIIAKDIKTQEIVFVEVKTRKNYKYGTPAESITNVKARHIKKVIEYFIHINSLHNKYIRIDVIELIIKENGKYTINHIRQAL